VRAGTTRVGSGRRADIMLEGATGVHDEHCLIVNDTLSDHVTIRPLIGQLTVDNRPITAPTKLVQGSPV